MFLRWKSKASLGLLAFLCLVQGGFAATVELGPAVQEVALGPMAEVWVDDSGQATLEQVREGRADFRPLGQRYVNRQDARVYWYRVRLHKDPADLRDWMVKTSLATNPTRVWLVPLGTKSEAPIAAPLWRFESQFSHFLLRLDQATDWELYLRTETVVWNLNWLQLSSQQRQQELTIRQAVIQALYYGSMLVMLGYNLLLFLSIRDRLYLYYVLALATALVFHSMAVDLLAAYWLSPEAGYSPTLYSRLGFAASFPAVIAFLLFTQQMLETKRLMPWVHRLMNGLVAYSALGLLAFPWESLEFLKLAVSVPGFFMPLLSLIAGLLAWRAGQPSAKYFLVAFLLQQSAVSLFALGFWGYEPLGMDLYQNVVNTKIASVLEILLLAFALGDRYNGIKGEVIRSQREIITLGERHAQELEFKVEERTRELSLANQTKDRFFSIIAHDLRGPIGSLSVFFNEMLKQPSDLDQGMFKVVRSTTRNTHQLLEDLLGWARSQRQEIALDTEHFPVRKVVEVCFELLAGAAAQKNIPLVAGPGLDLYVAADPSMVTTVVRNLVGNAVKFSPESGQVTLSARKTDDGQVEVGVTDHGIGVPPGILDKLFKAGEKIHSQPGTNRETGSGLGLVLCAEFVAKNGGQIGVQSQVGQGSRFWFTLPQGTPSEVVPDLEDPDFLAQVGGLKVLVAEDNGLHQETTAKVLQDLGMEFQLAQNGLEAVAMAGAVRFNLVLMDIDLPGLNGLEATRRIRQHQSPAPWVLALSAYSKPELDERAEAVEFEGYINKPLSRTELLVLLRPLLA
ncbi:MAG: hypothetical protein A2600_11600 [Candidatus Lambdaproteobacteria bacterium RIFOXYD1_FULL_56_27]|uniref:histidine kinase n=1 Tax=Candidatus Lambdaproteobacteria bacterium RIFOXYD2_FULL_56_26 TaxID=1817773 RepID=A0A1F6GYU5_9PROT|nr:MAG: hypothetical protein A2426_06230 [Candidatus Lambdaproteobacteria bacterium RIFOXYC1_FULL_56_13]OGH03242.1 MAG: hypothetical protein A2557_00775 [Candidatus Lambdaproteobacteria bacterium RIFOXYD2_FULL_56_26]OGH08179.1 MAG: hypothetical protein A2600_11600 [Candidatus Lambdaproteobacteria bacterium RIFOXYD1_FULL_56_27]